MSRLISLYPGPWRERYEVEFLTLISGRQLSIGDRLDIVRGALDARLHPQLLAPSRFDVARTPHEVYEFLTDTSNWARMDPALVSLTSDDPIVVGSSGTATHRRAGGFRATTSWQVMVLEPGARLAMRIVGRGFEITETIDLAATTRGTAVQMADRLTATSALGRLMVRFSGGIVERDLRERSGRLKSLVEAGAPAGPVVREAG